MWLPEIDPYDRLIALENSNREIAEAINDHQRTMEQLIRVANANTQNIRSIQRDIQNLNNRLTRAEKR